MSKLYGLAWLLLVIKILVHFVNYLINCSNIDLGVEAFLRRSQAKHLVDHVHFGGCPILASMVRMLA